MVSDSTLFFLRELESRLLSMCFRFFFLLFSVFLTKLKWREGESQVGMDTCRNIKHGILVLFL